MNRIERIQRKATAAIAAMAVSAFFVIAAVGPAMNINADAAFAAVSNGRAGA